MNIEHSEQQNRSKKRHWLKRIGIAVLIPVVLMVIAFLLLTFMGDEATDAMDKFLNSMWLPLSLIRLAIYIAIAFVFLPFFIRRASKKNQLKIEDYQRHFDLSENEYEKYQVSQLLEKAEAQQVAYSHYVSKKVWVIVALLVFDIAMIQLPYFLRG